MELNFASDVRGERCGGDPGNLAQKFFQSFLLLGGDSFDRSAGRGCGLAKKFLGKANTRGDGHTQAHLAVDSASRDHRVPEIGLCGGQCRRRDFEAIGLSGNLRKHSFETVLPGLAPIANFGPEFGG